MSDQLSELDELIESDVLEALGEKIPEEEEENTSSDDTDDIIIEDIDEETSIPQEETLDEDDLDEPTKDTVEEEEVEKDTIEDLDQEEIQELPCEKELQVNTTDLASLLSELLNNKTIEITIKVKD